MRALLACSFLAVAVVASLDFAADSARRAPSESFMTRYDVSERRPDAEWDHHHAPSSDGAALVASAAAVADVTESVALRELSPELQRLWLQAVEHGDDALRDSLGLMTDAIRARPAAADYFSQLGRAHYLRVRRNLSTDDLMQPARWMAPLRLGLKLAPGDDSAADFLSAASLESWSFLDAPGQTDAKRTLRRALFDAGFAWSVYPTVVAILGSHDSLALLPDSAPTLRVAMESVTAPRPDAADLASLLRRWERAEWQARVADLREIESHRAFGDSLAVAQSCESWTRTHPIEEFDSPAGHAQLLQLLGAWPSSHAGSWHTDGRARVIRFLLDRRDLKTGGALSRAAAALNDLPPVYEARMALRDGDRAAAESIFHDNATEGDWSSYLAESVPSPRGAGRGAGVRGPQTVVSTSRGAAISLDIDNPSTLTITAPEDALVHYGSDGGRTGSLVLIAGKETTINIPKSTIRIWPARATPVSLTATVTPR